MYHETLAIKVVVLQNYTESTYNEFGYNEHPVSKSRFICIEIIDWNVNMYLYFLPFVTKLIVEEQGTRL